MKLCLAVMVTCAAAVAASGLHQPPASVPAPAAAAAPKSFTLADAAFLAGAWQGDMGGELVEEHWTVPSGSNITGMPPLLSGLGDNGGTTRTHAVSASSPAIDAGRSFCLETDQRGSPRPSDLGSDQARSKRSRFMTLAHAATKSCTNFSLASSAA